ncbi:MAG: tRNA pseudouridine(55) synthase TruB [Candidatus Krumholzibacteriia bacterium]
MTDDGLLLVDKPAGVTSHDVVDRIRRTLGRTGPAAGGDDGPPAGGAGPRLPGRGRRSVARVGHAGTLDPLATGLLLVMTGRATRLAPFLVGLDKAYLALVRFGAATETLDREGSLVERADPPEAAAVVRAAEGLRGEVEQVPPVYSAIKRDGRALHRRARAGEDVAPPPARRVVVARLDVRPTTWGAAAPAEAGADPLTAPDGLVYEAELDVRCSSGTYVRSIARDLALLAGTVGHLRELRRLAVGPFTLAGALGGEALDDAGALRSVRLPLADALPHLAARQVPAEVAARIRQGAQPEPDWLELPPAAGTLCRLHGPDGELVAVCRREAPDTPWRTAAVFPETTL